MPILTPDDLYAPSMPTTLADTPAMSRSLLERLLSPLDWGRQSLTNLGEGSMGLLGGDFSRENLAKTLPGLGGILAGALTGGVAAPLVGTGIASLLQGAGNEIAPRAMRAMSTSDLVSKLGGDPESTLHNLAVGAATDPWTYAMGMGGMRLGEAAIGRAGKALDTAALARGPRFGGEAADLVGHLKGGPASSDAMANLLTAAGDRSPNLWLPPETPASQSSMARALSEVPGGSRLLGGGGEGVAFKTPYGRVVRLGMEGGEAGVEGRPISSSVLQADRTVSIPAGNGQNWRIEHTPFAEDVGGTGFKTPLPVANQSHPYGATIGDLIKSLEADKLNLVDAHTGNVGRYMGRPVVIDPGAIEAAGQVARQPVIAAKEPTLFTRKILDMLGADEKLRSALVRGHQNIDLAKSLPSWLKYGMDAGGAGAGAAIPLTLRDQLEY